MKVETLKTRKWVIIPALKFAGGLRTTTFLSSKQEGRNKVAAATNKAKI